MDGQTNDRTDGRTDTQKFGGYNIIARHFLWQGIKKAISAVLLIVIAFEYAKIFLSLHFAQTKSMLTALNIRYFGAVIHKTHSWMTTYIAASPRFKNKFVEDLGKLGYNFHEMVDLSSPHTYMKLKASTINCECEFSKKVKLRQTKNCTV